MFLALMNEIKFDWINKFGLKQKRDPTENRYKHNFQRQMYTI